ncbi:MAG: carboxypeptidase regulatory-like domain-containing protein, partial [Thermoanaerobaculales bacterium]|nr:carboxypeptidase regulatory-like domain-containing protein [Thermoanaerobaculales bacterium]
MESRTKLRVLVTVGLALVVGLALPVAAQISTGTIEINTVDEQALPMPGVTGRVVNTETGAQRASVSDVAGLIIIPALPPGEYNVGVELPGFAPANGDVTIRIGQTARLVFTMKVQMSETITVTGEAPIVDVLKNDSSTNITPEQIQDLPVPSREFERLAYIAPGTNRERGGYRFIQNAVVVGAGGNASQTTFMVDGVELTDQALGLSRARFSMDAIREFRVVTARFDPEIGGSQGGALNVATKSGTNEVHGSVFGFYRGADLRQTGALEVNNDDFQRHQVGFTIGGPITRDKMHYFLSFEQIGEDNVTLFRPGGFFVNDAADVPDPFDQTLALGSFDIQFGQSASGFAKIVYEDFSMDNFRVGGVSAGSHGQTLNRNNWNVILGHTKVFGDGNHVNELRMQGGSRYYEEPTNSDAMEEWFTSGTTLQIGTNTLGDLEGDGTYFELRDTYHWHLTGNRSTHDLKMGGAWMHIDERSDIPVYQNGTMLYLTDDR